MRKGIASHVMTIVFIIAIFGFFILLLVYNWIVATGLQASETLCTAKILNYCTDWWKNGFNQIPWDWNGKDPQGCEKFNIRQPVNPDDCKALLGVK